MPWRTVNNGSGNILCVSKSFDSLVSAAASGVPLLEWPFANKIGRVIAVTMGADTISAVGDILGRLRRFDDSASTTNFMDTAGAIIPADDFVRLDDQRTTTVEGESLLDQGDRVLFDKDAGGSLTRAQINVYVSHG